MASRTLFLAVFGTLATGIAAGECGDYQYMSGSASNCSAIDAAGYEGYLMGDGGQICTVVDFDTPEVDGLDCELLNTAASARAFCEDLGMRLCTKEDYESDSSLEDHTPCGFANSNTYIGTPCDHGDMDSDPRPGYLHDRISLDGSDRCLEPDQVRSSGRAVRCCADVNGPACSDCPAGTMIGEGEDGKWLGSCMAPPGMELVFAQGTAGNSAADLSTRHAENSFRSCSAGEYASGSAYSCDEGNSELGWEIVVGSDNRPAATGGEDVANTWWKQSSDSSVCAKTQKLESDDVTCKPRRQANVDHDRASLICESNGARLCTLEELSDDETAGTGCNYNWKRVWSGTPCTRDNGVEGFWSTSGAKSFRGRIGGFKCDRPTKDNFVRCCADDPSGSYPSCNACPAGRSSPSGTESLAGCTELEEFECTSARDFRAGSLRSCETLTSLFDFTMTGVDNSKNGEICVGAMDHKNSCPSKKTYSDAGDYCAELGARLCTFNEIKLGVGEGYTQCGEAYRWVWTADRSGMGTYATTRADGKGGINLRSPDARSNVMCCADSVTDVDGSGYYCEDCPSNNANTGATSKTSLYECEASGTRYKTYPIMEEAVSGGYLNLEFTSALSCANDEYASVSTASCGDLGLASQATKRGSDDNVCGMSRIYGQCHTGTAAEADDTCSNVGARVCSADELQADEAARSGCHYDNQLVWTAESCGDDDTMRRVVGGSSELSTSTCVSATDSYAIRCCADVAPHCKSCPENYEDTNGVNVDGGCSCPDVLGPDGCQDYSVIFVQLSGRKRVESFQVDLSSSGDRMNAFRTTVGERFGINEDDVVITETEGGSAITGNSRLNAEGITALQTIYVEQTCESITVSADDDSQKYACGATSCGAGFYLSGSTQSCTSLGLTVGSQTVAGRDAIGNGETVAYGDLRQRWSGDRFCGTAYDTDTSACMAEMTFSDAKQFCSDKGMRMCRTQEVIENIPLNDADTADNNCWGSSGDPKAFWTLKPCSEAANDVEEFEDRRRAPLADRKISYYVQGTEGGLGESSDAADATLCLDGSAGSDDTALVACCADDTPVDTQFCNPCPANSCTDYECPVDAASNVECICDDDYRQYEFINGDMDRTAGTISRPVCHPFTSAPTSAPTPENDHLNIVDLVNDPTGATTVRFEVGGNEDGDYDIDFDASSGTRCSVLAGYIEQWCLSRGVACDATDIVMTHSADIEAPPGNGFDCGSARIGSMTHGMFSGDYVRIWPWTYCPSDYYRWGSRLPCDVEDVPWDAANDQGDYGYGPGLWHSDHRGGCRGWCKTTGTDPSDKNSDLCDDISSDYFVPTGVDSNGDAAGDTEICTTSGGTSSYVAATEALGDASDVVCSGQTNYADSKSFCESRGSRLCTVEELRKSCAERTGCDYDYIFIWSDEACTTAAGNSGHYVLPGDQRKWFYRLAKESYMVTEAGVDGSSFANCGIGMPLKTDTWGSTGWTPAGSAGTDGDNWPIATWHGDPATVNMYTTDNRYPYYYCDAIDTSSDETYGGAVTYPSGDSNAATISGKYVNGVTSAGRAAKQFPGLFTLDHDNAYPSMFYHMFYDQTQGANADIDETDADFLEFGQFCLDDTNAMPFTRCCADFSGSFCRACPAGKTRAAGAEDFSATYVNAAGNYWSSGSDRGQGDGVETWGSQYDSCVA